MLVETDYCWLLLLIHELKILINLIKKKIMNDTSKVHSNVHTITQRIRKIFANI